MGVKLRPEIGTLEASISNGVIHVYYFDRIIKSVDLGIPKSIEIPRQCNIVNTAMGDKVISFLSSDKYVVIVRINGTVDVLSNDFILLFKSKINIIDLLEESVEVYYAGSLSIMNITAPAYLSKLSTGEVFLYSDKIDTTILLDMNDKLSKCIYNWAKEHNDVGTMLIVDNRTACSKLWVNFGTKETFNLTGYKAIRSNGIIGGVL